MQPDRSAVALQRQEGRVSSSPALSTPPDSPATVVASASSHSHHHGRLGSSSQPSPDALANSHDLSHPRTPVHAQPRLASTSNPTQSAENIDNTALATNVNNNNNNNNNNSCAAATVKKTRKKREQSTVDATAEDRPKEKRARKPREPRGGQNQNNDAVAKQQPVHKLAASTPNNGKIISSSSNNADINSYFHTMPAAAGRSPESLRPASSGQHFDPVRSVSIEAGSAANRVLASTSPGPPVPPPPPPPIRAGSAASATASIHSLIDPIPASSASTNKTATSSSAAAAAAAAAADGARQPSDVKSTLTSPSRQADTFDPSPALTSTSGANMAMAKPATPQHSALSTNGWLTPTTKAEATVAPVSDPKPDLHDPMAMEIDTPARASSDAVTVPSSKKADAPSATAGVTPPSNKPNRQKEISLPPLPGASGTGLLNPASAPPNGAYAVNICLHFDLRGKESLTFSFAREVEKKYGRDALHPRRAAHRDRMARMAAATAALEKDSSVAGGSGSAQDGSDLSEMDQDNDQEMDMDSTAEGGPADDAVNGNPHTGSGPLLGKGGRKKRRPNKNEYNFDDDFIDDAELAWEEQAAVATGGFFVYSGPLVTEAEKPAVERADGTTKRGRGRGRGGSARGDSNAGTHGNSTRGDASGGGRGSRGGRGGRGGGRGGGGGNEGVADRGDRGGAATNGAVNGGAGSGTGSGTTRKPRITKAEKAERAAEKEREKAEKVRLKEIRKEEKAAANALGKAATQASMGTTVSTVTGGSVKKEPAQAQLPSEIQTQAHLQPDLQSQVHDQNRPPPGGVPMLLTTAEG